MANKKSAGILATGPSYDYQCEEDVRTLTRAAEVMADRGRASSAIKKFKKTKMGVDRLSEILSRRGPIGR